MKVFFCILTFIFLLTSSVTASNSWAHQTHPIKKGETLSKIAKSHGTSVRAIQESNGLVGTSLQPGRVLHIPARTAKAGRDKNRSVKSHHGHSVTVAHKQQDEVPSRVHPKEGTVTLSKHVVERGENLYRISIRFGTTVAHLKELNHLKGVTLQIGQALQVPSREEEMPDVVEEKELDPSLEEGGVSGGGEEPLLTDGEMAGSDEDITSYLSESADGGEEENTIVAFAKKFLGVPYRFGGESRKGIDCSAFVQRVFQYFSVDLPRTAREQFKAGVKVSTHDLQVGDLIFFQTYAKYPSHVGIYMGEGKMIHASSRYHKVTITELDMPYYRKRFVGVIRIPDIENRLTQMLIQ
jgi:cell wall-associated NlpC family hydrolase